jgi:tRNA (mo5U34)-methyltransferase
MLLRTAVLSQLFTDLGIKVATVTRRLRMQSTEQVEQAVRSLGWWYQHFQLPSGIWTGDGLEPAYSPEERWRLLEPYVPTDLHGKTILDVGGNAGYFSIQMKLRGAKKSVLVEPYEEFVEQARFASDQFGVKLKIVNEDIHTFCLTTRERFDYVLFLGTFYHLKYPVLVLDRLAEMTKERMYFQSHIAGDKPAPPNDTALPRLSFVESAYRDDYTNWWIPDYAALEPLVRSAGLRVLARPHPEMIVAEPDEHFGTRRYRRLLFPRYGKRGHDLMPGPQRVDAHLWRTLLEGTRDQDS